MEHIVLLYRIYRMYSDRQAWANSVVPDAAEWGISSGSILFATHPAMFGHNMEK